MASSRESGVDVTFARDGNILGDAESGFPKMSFISSFSLGSSSVKVGQYEKSSPVESNTEERRRRSAAHAP
jgi:hypothetical protein